jgi:hypothetical protein
VNLRNCRRFWGRREARRVNGGLARRRAVDSGERVYDGVERKGGRRRSSERRSEGRVEVEDGGGCGAARGRRRAGLVIGVSDGFAVESAEISSWCFVAFMRCFLSSSSTASRSFRAGSFLVEQLGFSTTIVRVLQSAAKSGLLCGTASSTGGNILRM